MSLTNIALSKTDDLPINHEGNAHSEKVRSAYWLIKDTNKYDMTMVNTSEHCFGQV